MKTSETVKAETDKFEVSFPAPFDVKPSFTVDMPRGCKAFIYPNAQCERTRPDPATGQMIHVMESGWRIVIVNRNGLVPKGLEYYRHGRDVEGMDFTEPLNIHLYLKAAAAILSVKRKTRSSATEMDDED